LKSQRFKYEYRDNASSLHKKVGDLLRTSFLFSNYSILQEYPVNQVNKSFPSGREKFDWVILELNTVIEIHGRQHFVPTDFSGDKDETEILQDFKDLQRRDREKKEAAESAGWKYILVKYNEVEDLTDVSLADHILFESYPNTKSPNTKHLHSLRNDLNTWRRDHIKKIVKQFKASEKYKELKKQASERQKLFRKHWKEKNKRIGDQPWERN